MRRITILANEELEQQFDELIERNGYENRSEAFRDLLRARIESERKTSTWNALQAVATVTYIYNFHERELAVPLAALRHDHHDLCVFTTHVVLNHDNCIETVTLRGKHREVKAFAHVLVAQADVRHDNVHLVPMHLQMPTPSSHHHRHFLPGS